MTSGAKLEPLPFTEAIEALRRRTSNLATSFSWMDIFGKEHGAVFTVAKAMQADVLKDIADAVEAALVDGTTLETFRARLTPLLVDKGWWGRRDMVDPDTGDVVSVQLGSPRRLKTIFDVNLRVSYAQGRWAQIQRLKDERPWLRYVAVMDARTRPLHRSWHGTVLRWDDPWYDTHYPPNGWNCRCRVVQLSDADLARFGFTPTDPPPDGTRTWVNRRTGEEIEVPVGVDPGFGHHHGKAADRDSEADRVAREKITALPQPLASAATAELDRQRRVETAVRQAIESVADEGRRTGHEHLVVVDRADGGVIERHTSGKSNTVSIPNAAWTRMADPASSITAVHNHPRGRSFSGADMAALGRLPGLFDLYAVPHDRGLYRIERTATTSRLTIDVHQKAARAIERELGAAVQLGTLPTGAFQLSAHLTARVLDGAGYVRYTYRLPDADEQVQAAHAAILEAIVNRVRARM